MPTETSLDAEIVPLRSIATATADEVKSRYEAEFGADPADRGGWYRPDDWARIAYVYSRLRKGGAFLDVGVGAGQFLNLVAVGGRFASVTGADPTRFNKYREFGPGITRVDRSVADLGVDDDAFDVVTCMEVLEHVPDEVFDAGLAELRRVCRGQLIVTVPFREPEPLSAGHLRRFDDSDVARVFPRGAYTLLDRPRMPWMLVEERPGDPGWPAARRDEAGVDAARLRHLERQVATLRDRKVIRAADAIGAGLRSARGRLARLVR